MSSHPCRFCRAPVEPDADFCTRCGGTLPHPAAVGALPDPSPPAEAEAGAEALALYPMSELKLVVMSICTLGVYEVWWFYRNWKLRRDHRGRDVWPVARGLFCPIFAFSLFEDVREEAGRAGVAVAWSSGLRAVTFFVLNALGRLPDPYWLVTLAAFIPLLDVQATINAVNARRGQPARVDSTFTGWNRAGIVLGGLFLLLAALGTFFPPE